jgi:hypothetical protein
MAASRTNVAVYGLDPTPIKSVTHPVYYDRDTSGFAEETGGRLFSGANVFNSAVDQIWSEAGHYYVIGYSLAAAGKKRTHTLDVRSIRSGFVVNARRTRAE